jgi:cytochrome c
MSRDGTLIAAAGIGGAVALIDRKARSVLRTLGGPGLPVWSVAFLPDNATVLTGGADGAIRRWNALTGDPIGSSLSGTPADPLAAFVGDHGAEIFRACVACHTLSEKDNARAGPTLAGLFGRRIASLPGYRFSDALKSMNIVWTPETVAKLFEVGPNDLYARHQDAGAAHRVAGRPQGAYRFPGARNPRNNHPLLSRSRK